MRRFHIVSDRNPCNGMFVAARMMAEHEEGSRVVTCAEFLTTDFTDCADYKEVVVHGCWLPCYWKCCWKVLRLRKGVGNRCRCTKDVANSTVQPPTFNLQPLLSRMTHANLDPVRLAYHGWKKRLVAPIERWLFKRCDKILVTCEEEKKWVSSWLGRAARPHTAAKIEILEIKRFFNLATPKSTKHEVRCTGCSAPLHVLYLGRRHPLKGVEYLEQAVKEINESSTVHLSPTPTPKISLRIVSDHYGEELERDWEWCDVLCLPTLSENFGLVIAEALERGKRVITTDGAPAWADLGVDGRCRCTKENALIYLRGYRDGSERERIELLKDALRQHAD